MQKLSPEAASAKKKRDLEYAKSPKRRLRKKQNQVKRRALKKKGFAKLFSFQGNNTFY